MRLAILTTGAVRRRYFVERISSVFVVSGVLIEDRELPTSVPTVHPLDNARKNRERNYWYKGAPPPFNEIADTQSFENLNEPPAVRALHEINPDIVLVYGTGKLSESVLSCGAQKMFNFHNGNAEEYRGLDCHLWPLYHKDFQALQITLHRIETTLDSGDIVDRRFLPLYKDMQINDLRRIATELTVEIALDALKNFQSAGHLNATPQKRKGRYYSHMPSVLKNICIDNFHRHTAKL